MTMTNAQAIAFIEKHVNDMEEFIQTLETELAESGKLDQYCVMMPAIGLPLHFEIGHYGDIIEAYQTGTFYGTVKADKRIVQKVASSVKDGKGNQGQLMTYRQLLNHTIEKQREGIEKWLKELDGMEAES